MSPQLSVFILAVLFVVGWFAVGTHFNVRKGEAALRWLQEGLPLVGEKTTLRWLGSSAVELKIESAKPPFRDAVVLVLLEPRDVPLIWWFSRLRGRTDLFIFRSALRSTPRREFEALDVAAWSARRAYGHVKERDWPAVNAPAPLQAFAPQASTDASPVIAAAALAGCPLVRLSVRRSEPDLEFQWRLDDVRKHSSREVFAAIRRVAEVL